jgi:hypothetical protein
MSQDQEHPFGIPPEAVISGLAILACMEGVLLFLVRGNGSLAVIVWAVSSAIDQCLWLPLVIRRLRRSVHLKARWALAGAFAVINVLADGLQGASIYLLRHLPPLYVTAAWYLSILAALLPFFLLVSLPAGRRYFRSFLWMDILQALFITCALYVLIFRALPFAPMPEDAPSPVFVVRLLGAAGASIALCLLLRYYAAADLDERRFYRLFAIIMAMATAAMTINNEVTLRYPEQVWTNILCYPQFLAQAWLLYRLPDEEPEARSARSGSLAADIINIGSPVLSSLLLLSLGLVVLPRQHGLGVTAIVVAFVTFATRSVIYLRNFEQAQAALERAQEQLRELSYTDALTRVPNRRAFDRALEQEWQHSARSGLPLSLLLIDVDYFKQLNDIAGHQAGDVCLVRIAGALRASTCWGVMAATSSRPSCQARMPRRPRSSRNACARPSGCWPSPTRRRPPAEPPSAWASEAARASPENTRNACSPRRTRRSTRRKPPAAMAGTRRVSILTAPAWQSGYRNRLPDQRPRPAARPATTDASSITTRMGSPCGHNTRTGNRRIVAQQNGIRFVHARKWTRPRFPTQSPSPFAAASPVACASASPFQGYAHETTNGASLTRNRPTTK